MLLHVKQSPLLGIVLSRRLLTEELNQAFLNKIVGATLLN